MNDNKINKFESETRISELNPMSTLIKAGFKENMTLCDIGAGTGIFSFPAAEISSNNIYALEISDSMIELLKNRIIERNTNNLQVKKVESDILPLDNKSCDMAIMVTVLHEIENKELMINEIKRVLKKKGKLMIIEFHKRKTPMGPPINHRISQEDVKEICNGKGFKKVDKFVLGDNFYSVVFEI
ncbi:methyltransferase domain-containing protein [Clostridiaceae bacterium 35-E11]